MSDETYSAPYPRFGEDGNSTTPPLPVPGYPLTDAVPSATGAVQEMPNVHDQVSGVTAEAFERDMAMQRMAARNAELEKRILALESKPKATAEPVVLVGGGEPVPHHLHLADGRVIANHGGTGTHYSETLPDGTSRVTRIKEYIPAVSSDPADSFN